jgi:hypothetical protein
VFAWIGGGCLLLVAAGTVAFVLWVRWLAAGPEDLEVEVEAPLEVRVGERFEVVASVENLASRPRTLVDLDVADSYLAGLAIVETVPPFSDAVHVPFDESLSHSFDLTVGPSGRKRVVFHMAAVSEGDFAGDIDFCVDSEVRCVPYPVRTLVRPAP